MVRADRRSWCSCRACPGPRQAATPAPDTAKPRVGFLAASAFFCVGTSPGCKEPWKSCSVAYMHTVPQDLLEGHVSGWCTRRCGAFGRLSKAKMLGHLQLCFLKDCFTRDRQKSGCCPPAVSAAANANQEHHLPSRVAGLSVIDTSGAQ